MPNWNRILIGDAFKVQQAGINYYRIWLVWFAFPYLGELPSFSVFSVSSVVNLVLALLSVADRANSR
jgi:hypothetical protein